VKYTLEVMEDGGDGRWKMEDGRQKMEDRRQKTEDGRWKMEDGRWKMEKTEDEGDGRRKRWKRGKRKRQKMEGGSRRYGDGDLHDP